MRRVEQPISLMQRQNRGHDQQTSLSSPREFVAKAGQGRGRLWIPPIRRQVRYCDRVAHQIVGHFANGEHQIIGRVIGVDVDEILQHGEGLVLGRVAEAGSRAGPASAVKVCALAIKGIAGVSPAQYAINSAQLIPP